MRRFAGKRTLLLGGSCDLSLHLARSAAAGGLFPILTFRNEAGRERIEKALLGEVQEYALLHLDLCRRETIAGLASLSDDGIDYMVDFAQENLEGLVASADAEAVAAYIETNIANRAAAVQLVARAMVSRRHGRMVYISSAAAGKPNAGQGFYAAAKLASEALYRNVGLELGSRGVTSVTLRPGYVNAGRGRQYLNQNADAALAKVPLGRALEIHEVVDTILFLLTDSAAGFNATVLTMDGGQSAGK